MRELIEEAFANFAKPIAGTDCTSWTGPVTGAGNGQVWVNRENNMARSVAQAAWFLEHGEDLNGTEFFLRNTCGNAGCTNPDHYIKKEYKNGPRATSSVTTVGKVVKTTASKKVETIPRYLLRESNFNDILQNGSDLTVNYYAKLYNIPKRLVKKIIKRTATLAEKKV